LKRIENGYDLKPYQFFRFADFNFAEWICRLCYGVEKDRILSGEVQRIIKKGDVFIVTLNSGQTLHCRRVVSALSIVQLNQIFQFTNRSYDRGNSIYLAYIPKDAVDVDGMPEAQFVLDESNAIYRISQYASSSSHLNVVSNEERTNRVVKDFNSVTGATINNKDIIYLREFQNARVKLSTNNYQFHQELLRANERIGIDLTGAASGFGVGSIADQIIQGLRLAAYTPTSLTERVRR
jgi:hypothetical protein